MSNGIMATFEGTTGREPELGTTKAGKSAVSLPVAVNRRHKDQNGNWGDGDTTWVESRMYGAMAENAAASVPKGTRVVVTGTLVEETFTKRDGTAASKLVCYVDDFAVSLRFATVQAERRTAPSQSGGWATAGPGQEWSATPAPAGQSANGEVPF